MISTIEFQHGEKTCASAPGVFCRWVSPASFGTRHVCTLFGDVPLFDDLEPIGWLKRCKQCVNTFGKANNEAP